MFPVFKVVVDTVDNNVDPDVAIAEGVDEDDEEEEAA
jgi:hypothetical protein